MVNKPVRVKVKCAKKASNLEPAKPINRWTSMDLQRQCPDSCRLKSLVDECAAT
jgi:hypothetical protein